MFGSGTSLKINRNDHLRKSIGTPQIPGFLNMIFRLIDVRRNEIQSQLPLFEAKSSGFPPRSAGLVPAHARPKCFIATGAVNAGMGFFGRSPPSRERGCAKPPHVAAWAGTDARCPSAGPVVRIGDNTRPGGCPAAPRVRSRSREDRQYLRCAICRKSPRRDLCGEHPGPESRVGKSRGYVSGRGTDPIEAHRAKGRGSGASNRFRRLPGWVFPGPRHSTTVRGRSH
jgi:hypothetical protein